MIGLLATTAALLYCFVWLRPPEVAGVAVPLQRVLAWAGLAVLLSHLLLKGRLQAGPAARGFIVSVVIFIGFLVLLLAQQLAFAANFHVLYFTMDLSKYAAAFAVAYLCYYALAARLVPVRSFIRGVMLSGGLATLLVAVFLILYYAGLRADTALIAPSFGGAIGVWPTEGVLPRLAGTTAEPQQFSVVLLTPLLLMLSREHIRRFWPIALLSGTALLLSQSKFAVVSFLVVLLYLFIVYPRWRTAVILGSLAAVPVLGVALMRLPTFSIALQQGATAGAFVERLENLVLLLAIIRRYPLFGIGPGHYGVFRGETLFGDWRYDPGYTPNMDFLKVFAETGVVGFLLMLVLLGFLVRLFLRSYTRIPSIDRPPYLAFFLGALTIILNMTIGYELLHAFFWINIGVLLYYVDRTRAEGPTASRLHEHTSTLGPEPVLQR
jgi:O-antigen ligase